MKHYPHHIGDFNQATRHLTRIERSIYRDLLDLYYDTEKQLPLDDVWIRRKVIAHSNEEVTAVEQVLNEFFTKTPTGWYHERCEAEIEAYQANTSQKALAGKASAEAKRLKKLQALNVLQTDVQQPLNSVGTAGNGASTNHQPSTNQPIKEIDKSISKRALKKCPESFVIPEDQFAAMAAECHLVDIEAQTKIFRDYTFKTGKTDWLATWRVWMRTQQERSVEAAGKVQALESFKQADARIGRERWEEMTGERHPDNAPKQSRSILSVIDVTPVKRIGASA